MAPPRLGVTSLLQEMLRWMDDHDDVLPGRYRQALPSQIEEDALRAKYDKRPQVLTDEQRSMQEEIDRRKTNRYDLDTVEAIATWSARHSWGLPVRSKEDPEQRLLVRRLENL